MCSCPSLFRLVIRVGGWHGRALLEGRLLVPPLWQRLQGPAGGMRWGSLVQMGHFALYNPLCAVPVGLPLLFSLSTGN